MPRKLPFRTGNEISQTYNDGIVKIFTVSDGATPGYQPVIKATMKHSLPFEERALGITRLFMGRQNRVEIEKVVRIPRLNVSTQDLAQTQDGKWYRIDSVQSVQDVRPASLDLSLVAEDKTVEVIS